ncbi:MAG: hypothetical protein CEN89_354 [Candidatus Berkelbacteria bacterium Licking1014_7]|uniref:YraN family protein n=1 Tax=Candidatus Berkelbacteria bacterium Licking1014_7 TaxID=2017147 RepID=A0A554LK12_9BACT|nr:MAG: hypothetical protein CEN89_354 [Candidatus Berkelbacteria bacterium Licking1014_7]
MNNRAIGNQAEDRACQFLRQNKYKILKRNWHFSFGEIDILARDRKKNICIIEVNSSSSALADASSRFVFFAQM